MNRFLVLWSGQTLSLLGTRLTAFALGVSVYIETGSVTRFALVTLFAQLPGILALPFVGALVDRWDRRRTMIAGNVGAATTTAVLASLVAFDALELWHLYMLIAVASIFNMLQSLAFSSSTVLLVGRESLGRAAGLTQVGEGTAFVLAPLAAPWLMTRIGLTGVIAIDALTFLSAVVTLLMVAIPRPEPSVASSAEKESLWRQATFGWRYLRTRPGLLALLAFFAFSNLVLGTIHVVLTPLVLELGGAEALGRVLASASLGMVVGAVGLVVWGGPRRRVRWIVAISVLQGVVLLGAATLTEIPAIAAVAFVFSLGSPFILGASQAIWQSQVEPDVQGRVFAFRRVIALSTLPLAQVSAGPLCDRLFEPLLASSAAPLAAVAGPLVGVGPGRGVALYVALLGIFLAVLAIVAWGYPPLQRLEEKDGIPAAASR
jgi:DHA3 family macrolide efflux protein-like MFS transporter